MSNIEKTFQKYKAVVFDFDGVFTNNKVIYLKTVKNLLDAIEVMAEIGILQKYDLLLSVMSSKLILLFFVDVKN